MALIVGLNALPFVGGYDLHLYCASEGCDRRNRAGLPFEWPEAIGGHSKQDCFRSARRRGWRFKKEYGFCPDCVSKASKGGTKAATPILGPGWARPANASKWHYFKAEQNVAICGRWMFVGPRETGRDSHSDNCTACRSRLSKEN